MSPSLIEAASIDFIGEVQAWNVFDANVRVGRSGVHGDLALEAPELLAEMDRFAIRSALVSHFAAVEYDAEEGNCALAEHLNERFVPAWAALPDPPSIERLTARRPVAVRLLFGVKKHNFSPTAWCAGELFDFLQQNQILAVIAHEDLPAQAGLEWDSLARLLENFPRLRVLLLETGYRADRYLFPLLRRFANLYFDCSTYLAHRQLESFVERWGPDRLVFGSRLPLYTPGAALAVLASARISDQARLAIAGGTLRQLLERASA